MTRHREVNLYIILKGPLQYCCHFPLGLTCLFLSLLYAFSIFSVFTSKAAISTERLKALEWMEKHNREKETMRELQVSF